MHQSTVRFSGGRYGGADPEEEVGVGSFAGEILEDVRIREAFGVSGGIENQRGPFVIAFEKIGSEGTSAGDDIVSGLEFAEEFVDERGFSGFGLTENENAEGGLFGEGGVGGSLLGFPFGLRAGEFAGFEFAEIEVAAVEFDGIEAGFFDRDLQEPLLEIEFGFLEEFTLGVGPEFANDTRCGIGGEHGHAVDQAGDRSPLSKGLQTLKVVEGEEMRAWDFCFQKLLEIAGDEFDYEKDAGEGDFEFRF